MLSGFPPHFAGIAALHARRTTHEAEAAGQAPQSSHISLDAFEIKIDRNAAGQRKSNAETFFDAFSFQDVKPWEPERFQVLRKLQDATRNRGQVMLMSDSHTNTLYAVKQMPNEWIRGSHQEFIREHPSETEFPWQDICCISFLKVNNFEYACNLHGVYRDSVHTYVVTTFATEGDLFSWCETGCQTGPAWEQAVLPVARQMFQAVQQFHDFGLVHRDLSLENILLSKYGDGALCARVIDFGMVSTARCFRNCLRGKASYQAPELHTDQEYDAYLSDAFSLGVTLYAVIMKDYPWLSTRPGGCKCCDYVRKHGFRSYLQKRKLRNSNVRVSEAISEPLKQLLEGLLAFDPKDRLTLGEATWSTTGSPRRSVWDEPWTHTGPGSLAS